jgi:hypothetical protein
MKKQLQDFLGAIGDYFANLSFFGQVMIAIMVVIFAAVFVHRFLIATGFKKKDKK